MNEEKVKTQGVFLRKTFYIRKHMFTDENTKAIEWLENADDFSNDIFRIIKKYVDGELVEKQDSVNSEAYEREIAELKKDIEEKNIEIIKKEQIIADVELRKKNLEDSLNLQIKLMNNMVINNSAPNNNIMSQRIIEPMVVNNKKDDNTEVAVTKEDDKEAIINETLEKNLSENVSLNDKVDTEKEIIATVQATSTETTQPVRMRRNVASQYRNQV